MKRTRKNTSAENNSRPAHQLSRTRVDHFGFIALILLLAASVLTFIRLSASGLLETRYLIIIMLVLIAINVIHIVVQVPLRRNKLGKLVCGILALILSAGMIWFTVNMESALNKIGGIFGQQLSENRQIVVVVRADDPAQELLDTVGYTYGYVNGWNAEDTSVLLKELHEKLGDFPERISPTPSALVEDLLSSQADAIILGSGALTQMEEMPEYAELGEKIRIIYTYSITQDVNILPAGTEITEPFVVYCNGIDSRKSDINATGNSDVNILAVVNPKSREVLLLNTPRDYYVPLHMNGQNDKLTHAGVYGIEESIGTLGDLYDVEVPYFIRLNFFGLVDLVDAVGGVDVESPKEFTTRRMQLPGPDGKPEAKSFSFPAGPVHLNGQEALAFSRERYAFTSGDNQRGINQMTVIRGIIDKITTPSVIRNYQKVLDALSNAFISNIAFDQIKALVRAQQQDSRAWHVTTYAVTGTGGSDYCYSWPSQKLYVTRPDADSVELAKTLIQQVMNGEVPVIPE